MIATVEKGKLTNCEELKSKLQAGKLDGKTLIIKEGGDGLYQSQKLAWVLFNEMWDMYDVDKSKSKQQYRDMVSIGIGYTKVGQVLLDGQFFMANLPKSWSYFNATTKDYRSLIEGLKEWYIKDFGELLRVGNHFANKKTILKVQQGGRCCACGSLFVDFVYDRTQRKRVVEVKADYHHALIHNTEDNQRKYPHLIDNLINGFLLCHGCNVSTDRSWGQLKDFDFLDRVEQVLKAKPNLNTLLVGLKLDIETYKIVNKIKSFDLQDKKQREMLLSYLKGIADFTLKNEKGAHE